MYDTIGNLEDCKQIGSGGKMFKIGLHVKNCINIELFGFLSTGLMNEDPATLTDGKIEKIFA